MRIIYLISLSLIVLPSCLWNPGGTSGNSGLVEVIYESSLSDADDKPVKRRSTNKGSRGNRCEDTSRCIDICDSLYDNNGSIDECGELRSSIVEEMEEIIDALRDDDITVKELERFNQDTFVDMLEVSAYPWVYTIIKRRVTQKSHAKTILAWIASNKAIWDAVRMNDGRADFSTDFRAYEGFAWLLNEAAGGVSTDVAGSEEYCVSYARALGICGDETRSEDVGGNVIIGAGKTFQQILTEQHTGLDIDNIYSSLPSDLSRKNEKDTCKKINPPLSADAGSRPCNKL